MNLSEPAGPEAPKPSGARAPRKWWQSLTTRWVAAIAGLTAGFVLSCAVAYSLGRQSGMPASTADTEGVTAWTCSMHPQVNLPKPGPCPICFMDLIPLEAKAGRGHPRELVMSADAVALADIQTTPVRRQFVTNTIRMVGKIDYDETKVAYITAWVPGRLDRLFINYTGVTVRKGDHLVEMYSPDLVVAQRELIQAWTSYQEIGRERSDQLLLRTLKSTEEKLRLLGMTQEQIDKIKQRGTPSDRMTIYAPIGGVVVHKNAEQGMYVETGTRIYTIADLTQLWVLADAYESDVRWLRKGQEIEFTTETYPGEIFTGRVTFIDEVLNEKTRTVKVRVTVPNEDRRLKPGMFVRAMVKSRLAQDGRVVDEVMAGKWVSRHHPQIVRDGPGKCPICGIDLVPAEEAGFVTASAAGEPPLVIPASAPLITGKRAVVYVRVDPLLFQEWHVLDWRQMVVRLRRKGREKEPSGAKHIWQLLDKELKDQLEAFDAPLVPLPLQRRMLAAFDQLLERRDFYRPSDWHGIKLPEEIRGINPISTRKFTAEELRLANRRLIEASFPELIKPATAEPTFLGQEVFLGERAGDYSIVRHGLSEGDEVVTQGNFKIDSALQIAAKASMMSPTGGATGGHHHHDGAPKEQSRGHEGRAEHATPDIEVPISFRVNLNPIFEAYLAASESLAHDDLAAAQAQLEKLVASSKQIDPATLDSDSRERWKTVANHLVFAAYETRDAKTRAAARRYFGGLSDAMLPLLRSFGHALDTAIYGFHGPKADAEKGATWLQRSAEPRNPYLGTDLLARGELTATYHSQGPVNVPASFRPQLDGLYDAYLKLKTQLVADKPAESAAAAVELREAIQRVDPSALDPQALHGWKLAHQQMLASLTGDLRETTIAALRTRFKSLSVTMLQVVDRFSHAHAKPLYKAFCPMAFNEKTAVWLQAETTIRNPYFPKEAKMLECGEFKRAYEPVARGHQP